MIILNKQCLKKINKYCDGLSNVQGIWENINCHISSKYGSNL